MLRELDARCEGVLEVVGRASAAPGGRAGFRGLQRSRSARNGRRAGGRCSRADGQRSMAEAEVGTRSVQCAVRGKGRSNSMGTASGRSEAWKMLAARATG